MPFFDIFDPRFPDFGIPIAVHGSITFEISDYQEFVKKHRLRNFTLDEFQKQARDAISHYLKDGIAQTLDACKIPVVQIEQKIGQITKNVTPDLVERFHSNFGVDVTGVDIASISVDKTSSGYRDLEAITKRVVSENVKAQSEVNVKNIHDMQRINVANLEETLRLQREANQYSQYMQARTNNLGAYQIEKQAEVGVAGADALGKIGESGAMTMSSDGGFNPAGLMTGMMLGGVLGQNMVGMMNGMIDSINNQQPGMYCPPAPAISYYVAINGQASGPYDFATLSLMVTNGSFSKNSLVWKQGMPAWTQAGTMPDLLSLFVSTPSAAGNVPPVPPAF